MDISLEYLLCLLATLVLSWATYRYYFEDSVWQDGLSDGINSLSRFIMYSFVVFIIFIVVLYSDRILVGVVFPFISVFIGSIIFQYGFLRMSEYQLARNVPRSKIRSASIGLVEIQGKVISEQMLTTPYSKLPCVYYRSELQEYREHSTSGSGIEYHWQTISTDTHRIPFYVKDETGQIPIYPTEAEFEIPQKESGYIGREGEDDSDQFMSSRVGDERYNEYFLSPNEDVFVLGTLALRKDTSISKAIQKGDNNSLFIISDRSKRELNDALKWQMFAGLVYGPALFIAGFIKILQLSELL